MVVALLSGLLIVGSVMGGYTLVYSPLSEASDSIKALKEEINGLPDKEGLSGRVERMNKTAKQLPLLKLESLPQSEDIAKSQYKLLLERLMQQARIEQWKIPSATKLDNRAPMTPDLGNKKPAYTRLSFRVDMSKIDIWQLADFLYEFYQVDLLHQITDITITRQNKATEMRNGLEVHLTIEAIILDVADNRTSLFPVTVANKSNSKIELTPAGQAVAAIGGGGAVAAVAAQPEVNRKVTAQTNTPVLATKRRDYSMLALRDIFYGILPEKSPELTITRVSDIQIKRGEPIPEVKISLSGEGADTAKVVAKATGSLISEGTLSYDAKTHTISFPQPNEEVTDAAYTTINLTATNELGKEAKSSFTVRLQRSPPTPKDDISTEIRLVLINGSSDGSVTALIHDVATPLKYSITYAPGKGIEVKKNFLSSAKPKYRPDNRPAWRNDLDYEHPTGILAISDESSSTKKTFKVVAIQSDCLIVADMDPPDPKQQEKGGRGGRPGGGPGGFPAGPGGFPAGPGGFPAGPGAAPRPGSPPRNNALAAVAGNAAIAVVKPAAPSVLYRWEIGKSLSTVETSKLTPEETRKVLKSVAENTDAANPVTVAK